MEFVKPNRRVKRQPSRITRAPGATSAAKTSLAQRAAQMNAPKNLISDMKHKPKPLPKKSPPPKRPKPTPVKRPIQPVVTPPVEKTETAAKETPDPTPTATIVAPPAHRFRLNKKLAIVSGVIIVAAAGFLITGQLNRQQSAAKTPVASSSPRETIENLKSRATLPKGKTINELGGWKLLRPPESPPLLAYVDNIGATPIQVTQQSLPTASKGDATSQIVEIAKKFNATNEIDAGTTKIYVGTSAKGPQSAIFTKNNLLIMIKTEEKIDDQAWVDYVKTLN